MPREGYYRARVKEEEGRLRYCIARRKELDRTLREIEIIAAMVERYKEEADRLIEDIRIVAEDEETITDLPVIP